MKAKKEPDRRTYKDKHPEKATTYDITQAETNTPQKVREGEEATAELIKKGPTEPKDGASKQPG
ncbi:MAG: hypothetical protein V4714_16300 [Bacteroidota bacterium]